MNTYRIEYTDTFGGQANYSWVKRKTVSMPELTHYGYDGQQITQKQLRPIAAM